MTPEAYFSLTGAISLPGWIILIFLPRRWPALNVLPARVLPVVMSALYAVLVLAHFSNASGSFDTLADVKLLFTDDWAALAGWVHFLAFDLAIGAMVAARMDRVGVGRIIQALILFVTLMLGPIGLFLVVVLEMALRGIAPLHRQEI